VEDLADVVGTEEMLHGHREAVGCRRARAVVEGAQRDWE
jgi:hypothetical protein